MKQNNNLLSRYSIWEVLRDFKEALSVLPHASPFFKASWENTLFVNDSKCFSLLDKLANILKFIYWATSLKEAHVEDMVNKFNKRWIIKISLKPYFEPKVELCFVTDLLAFHSVPSRS